jgi:hypothetical protein
MMNTRFAKSSKIVLQRVLFLSALVALAAPVAFAGDRLIAGEYEITSVRDGRTTTSTYCATPEMANGTNGNEAADRAYVENAAKTCKIDAFKLSGDTIDYTMNCSGAVTTIHAVYHGDHFEGDVASEHGGQKSVAHTTAKRLGACK